MSAKLLPPGSELIIYYIGHGCLPNGKWVLKGVQDDTNPSLSSCGFTEVEEPTRKRDLFSMEDCVKLNGKNPPLPVTVASESCHSGAWLQQDSLAQCSNLRIIAACSKEQTTKVREFLTYLTQGIKSSTADPHQLRLNYNHDSVLCFTDPV